jgi:hypothetical protein
VVLTDDVTAGDAALLGTLEWLSFDASLRLALRRSAATVMRWFLGKAQRGAKTPSSHAPVTFA